MNINDKTLQYAYMQFFQQHNPTHFITLAFNRDISDLYRAAATLSDFHARLDRKLVGKRWNQLPPERRTLMFGIPEIGAVWPRREQILVGTGCGRISVGLHYHLLTRFPLKLRRELDLPEMEDLVHTIWKSLVPSGSVDVQAVYSSAGVASYVTKQISNTSLLKEHLLILPPARTVRAAA